VGLEQQRRAVFHDLAETHPAHYLDIAEQALDTYGQAAQLEGFSAVTADGREGLKSPPSEVPPASSRPE
jgi:hypothetical protein